MFTLFEKIRDDSYEKKGLLAGLSGQKKDF
jgi:hypothetical protein